MRRSNCSLTIYDIHATHDVHLSRRGHADEMGIKGVATAQTLKIEIFENWLQHDRVLFLGRLFVCFVVYYYLLVDR